MLYIQFDTGESYLVYESLTDPTDTGMIDSFCGAKERLWMLMSQVIKLK